MSDLIVLDDREFSVELNNLVKVDETDCEQCNTVLKHFDAIIGDDASPSLQQL